MIGRRRWSQSKANSLTWRTAGDTDLDSINAIADATHVDLPERPEVFAEKLRLFPQGCFVLAENGTAVGYAVSHPWYVNKIPPLDAFLSDLPPSPDCLFIHDVAVAPNSRRQGAAGKLIETLSDLARRQGISALALVSVYDTHPLWARHGFQICSSPELSEKLKSYGTTAKYMRRPLSFLTM